MSLLTIGWNGLFKERILGLQDDLERQQTSPRAPLMAVGAYRVDPSGRYHCCVLYSRSIMLFLILCFQVVIK